MFSQFSAVLILVSLFSSSSSTEDFYGENIDYKTFKHPYSTLLVHKPSNEIQLDRYYSPTELRSLLFELGEKYDNILEVKNLASTVPNSKREIWAARLSTQVYKERPLLRPMFKFVANLYGDDAVGYAMMVSLIQYLTYNYRVNSRITRMLNNTDIWIVPNSNEINFEKSSEGTCGSTHANGFPINRKKSESSTDFFDNRGSSPGYWFKFDTTPWYLNDFIWENPFVLSGNLQGGAIVANYPFDWSKSTEKDEMSEVSSRTSDDDVFKMLAHDYADRNSMMKPGTACNNSFPGGITNGDDWQKRSHGMQDFNYLNSNCFEITFFLSCCKYPLAKFLPIYWEANLESMLRFIENTRRGIYGLVKDSSGNPVIEAVIKVDGRDKVIKVTERGEYWRLLVPGSYNVTVSGRGFTELQQEVHLNESHPYVQLDFVVHRYGIYGTVLTLDGYPIKEAVVKIATAENKTLKIFKNTEDKMNVDKKGEYWWKKGLGIYEVTVSAPKVESQVLTVELTTAQPYAKVDFKLQKSICRRMRKALVSFAERERMKYFYVDH